MPLILPPHLPERVVCSVVAAVKYHVPANLLLAVAEQENGKPGQWVKNKNGSDDVGVMQFNTRYLAELHSYGIMPGDVAQSGCYPFDLAAWRISGHLRKDKGDIWTRAADYHSYTQKYNAIYRVALIKKAAKWESWLKNHFITDDIQQQQNIKNIKITPLKHPYNIAAARALAAEFAPNFKFNPEEIKR